MAEAAAKNIDGLKVRNARLEEDRAGALKESQDLELSIKAASEYRSKLTTLETYLKECQESLDQSRLNLGSRLAFISKMEAEKELASKAKEELDKILPEMQKVETDRKDWALLSKAFSKTGIQSLEIDAAGPTVSQITNDLLFGCFGPRFSVRFVTQEEKDSGHGLKDAFDVYVTDANSGREGSIDDLSGGGAVIVGEAVALAISLFNRSRARTGWSTLFRDEASSAVDDKRAPLYISMLRRARELGHFEKLYFIAHQSRVLENADSKIKVDSGHVTLE
jgi:exonuclease SbcC